MFQKIKEYYERRTREMDARRLIYNCVMIIAIVALSLIILIERIMEYEQDGLLAMVTLFLYLVAMFILSNLYPKKLSTIIPFITVPLNLAVFPFMYILAEGGGIRSGMPVWMTMGILLLYMTADGAAFTVQLVLTVAVDAGLILYSYYHPNVVKVVDNEFYYYEDNLIAICVVALCIGFMIIYQRKVLEKQNARIEQVLGQTREEKLKAQMASKEKDKLMESLSYDIRTPLNAIAGMSDMAQLHIDDPDKVQECLKKINESSWEVLQIINHILDIEEFDTRDHFDPDELVAQCTNGKIWRDETGALMLDAEGKHILVVEDNEINLEIVKGILERIHAQVTFAVTGEEALELIGESEEFAYNLILMDIQLPGIDGYSVVRSIRSMDRADALQVPILAMTADVLAQDVNKAIKCGMNAHIAKPILIEELFTKLYYYLYISKNKS